MLRSPFEDSTQDVKLEIKSKLLAFDPEYDRTLTALTLSSKTLFQAYIGDKLLLDFSHANLREAENIIRANPQLLFYAGMTRDHAGNIIYGVTPLEIAYGNDDVEMCEMALPYLDQIVNGRQRVLQKIERRFPVATLPNYDFNSLVSVFMDQDDFQLMKDAAKEFIAQFKPHVIHQGKPFDFMILIKGIQACSLITKLDRSAFTKTFVNFRKELFSRLVVGGLQRCVSDYYAKILCAGPKNVLLGKKKLGNYDLDMGEKFFPLDNNPTYRLGEHYAVTFTSGVSSDHKIYNGTRHGMGLTTCGAVASNELIAALLEIYNKNQAGLARFLQSLRHAPVEQASTIVEEFDTLEDEFRCSIL